MYLKQLTITKNDGTIIRDIFFKSGLNIILGEPRGGGSTNNLGKTTLMRCLNFCLGGQIKEFYSDHEHKTLENKTVKDFMRINKLKFTLILGVDLNESLRSDITLERVVLEEEKKGDLLSEYIINGEKYGYEEFCKKLQLKIFKSQLDKPTFRQLIPKFLRRSNRETNNILRYLVSTSDNSYSAIWFFLFGFKDVSSIDERLVIIKSIKDCTNKINTLKKLIPQGAKQIQSLLKKELESKVALRDNFIISEDYSVDEDALNILNKQIFTYEKELSDLLIQRDIFQERKKALQSDAFHEDPKIIKGIYDETGLLGLSNLAQKRFEETIQFHNSMLQNEIQYIDGRLSGFKDKELEIHEKLSEKRIAYNNKLNTLGREGALAQYTELNNEINKLSLSGAEISSLLAKHDELLSEKEALDKNKSQIEERINSYLCDFEEKINIFNSDYFSPLTDALYKEKWLISFESDNYKFGIGSIDGNAGPGKKKSIVSAFDIAYMQYIQDEQINLPFPRFATHDQVELTDVEDLRKLKEFMDTIDGQFLFPIIHDKFESLSEEVQSDVILTLSREEKFFKIP